MGGRVEGQVLTPAQRVAWLRLIRTENVGPNTFRQLLNRYGSAERALEQLHGLVRRSGTLSPPRVPSVGEAEDDGGLVVDVAVAEAVDIDAVGGEVGFAVGVVGGAGFGGVGPEDDVLDAHLADEVDVLLGGFGGDLGGDLEAGGDPVGVAGRGGGGAGG